MSADANTLWVAGQPMILRDVTPADQSDVLALHQSVFGAQVDGAWFDWKYKSGGGEGVGLWHQGQLIAHCGGVPRTIWHAGVRKHDLQIGDVMVTPQWRGILTRRGPFFQISKRLYESRLGMGRRFFAGFGFPSARHLQLAVKSGLAWRSGVMTELHWTTPARIEKLLGWRWQCARMNPDDAIFDGIVNQAWQRMQKEAHQLHIGERNAAYVRWRYLQRPAAAPLFLQLRHRWLRQTMGVAVLSVATEGHPQWLDWIGPLTLLPQACIMCRAELAGAGATGMRAWVSEAVLQRLSTTDIAEKSEVAQIGVPIASSIAADAVANLNWWFMGGDTDFL